MRRLLVLLMVLLLPLRGWAGEVMSLQMAMQGAAPVQAVHVPPPGCPMHAQADRATVAAEAAADTLPAGMEQCAACQLCIPLASLRDARVDVPTLAGHAAPLMPSAGFMSAPVVRADKPPRV